MRIPSPSGSDLPGFPIHLGTATFGVSPDPAAAPGLVSAAIDCGITMFDTADSYGNQADFDRPGMPPHSERDSAEEILGACLAGRRDRVCIASKVGEPLGEQRQVWPRQGMLTRRRIHTQIEQTLRRLRTDYLDLYYAHLPDPQTPVEETAAAFAELVDRGMIRAWAVSNYSAAQWREISAVALRHPPITNQVRYSLADRSIDEDGVTEMAQRLGQSVVAYSPLGGGLLAGRRAMARSDVGDLRWGGTAFTETQMTLGNQVAAIAQQVGVDPAVLALSWVLNQPSVDGVVVGTGSVSRLTALCAAANFVLTDDVRAELARIV